MAGQRTNEWKLGLFVVTCLGVGFGGLIWLGAHRFEREIIQAWTYLDESVQGLEQGSAVKFRGVNIGTVAKISVAPDQRRVAVLMHIYEDQLASLGLRKRGQVEDPETPFVPPDVRVQLASSGLTGGKFLSIDLFPNRPRPELPFPVPWNHVPATPSTLKSLEETVTRVAEEAPKVVDEGKALIQEARQFLRDVDATGLSSNAQRLMTRANDDLAALDLPGLRARIEQLLDKVGATLDSLERVSGDVSTMTKDGGQVQALVSDLRETTRAIKDAVEQADVAATSASLRSTSGSVGTLSQDLSGMSTELRQALTSLRDAADKVKTLADLLERDPGSLIHGRSPGAAGPGGRR